jgi:uncharacterized membrane protein
MAKKIKEQKAKAEKTGKSGSVENEKLCAALSYILLGIIWYFADEKMKKSEFAKFHAKQGIVLLIAWVIVGIVYNIPLIGWFVLGPILNILLLVLLILGVVNAFNNQEKELPIIGSFGNKMAF